MSSSCHLRLHGLFHRILLLESHAGPSKALSGGAIYILSFRSTIDICTQGNATKGQTALNGAHNVCGCDTDTAKPFVDKQNGPVSKVLHKPTTRVLLTEIMAQGEG